MDLTKEQLSELICKHSERENGFQDLMEMMMEGLMVSERRAYLREEGLSGNKCNGYRPDPDIRSRSKPYLSDTA